MLRKTPKMRLVKPKNNTLRRYSVIVSRVILLSFICSFLNGCAVEKGKVYEKDGRLYGETEGLFKAKWEDYYLRGLSYSEGGFWEDAASDFMVAMQKRGSDQRRARTYGMHFIDYFPNRELGIAYFNLGKFKEAIELLETSLANVETARAKFYLNRARKAWLKETRLDTTPPAIKVQFPPPVYKTNGFSISVEGTARDDFFISHIVFNGKSSRLELSQREVPFKEEFLLHHGKNVITLQSEDILGKSSASVTLQVKVDREGPLVFLEASGDAGNTIKITGAVYDKSAIAEITLNDKTLDFGESQLVIINKNIGSHSGPADSPVQFEAEDVVGNKTTGYIKISSLKKLGNIASYPRIAFAKGAYSLPSLPVMTLPQLAGIDLKGLRDGQTTFFNNLSVEGVVWSAKGIQDLTINGQSLLSLGDNTAGDSFLKLLKKNKGRPLVFSKTIKLEEGGNTITTSLADVTGKVAEKTVTITRKIPKVRQISSRMTVAPFPFTEKKKTEEELRNYVYTFLTHSFEDQKRFNVLGRAELDRVLEKQRIDKKANFDQKTAIRLARLMGSETVLVGDISATEKSIEIFARLIDTENSFVLAEKDIYWEGGLTAGFRGILDELALKFKQHLPLCEGAVVNKESGKVIIDLGSNQLICQSMRFLAFREREPIIDSVTGMNLGRDTEILGLLSVKEINQESSKADILKKFTWRGIQSGNKVIAK